MNTRISTMAVMAALCGAALAGCAQTSPRFDAGFGTSVRSAMAAQVADPSAVGNANPVSGIDGRAAAATQGRYEQSFTRPTEAQSMLSGRGR
jgi:type IV pilus biogenesis protein CpaD/CtpE